MVLAIGQDEGPAPKCYVQHSTLPSYIDTAQPPVKKEPFRTVLEQPFSHTVCTLVQGPNYYRLLYEQLQVLLPAGKSAQAFSEALTANSPGALHYARVHLRLLDILSNPFFTDYVKLGDVLMLSQGRRGVDEVFELRDGLLRLEVDKATFEHAGLEGKAVRGEGRKHVKAQYLIELNLRLPSMLHGKKGFERILWACKNVFDYTVTWLFYDLRAPVDGQGALAAHVPTVKSVEPEIETLQNVAVPVFPEIFEEDKDAAAELLEWLSLISLRSPRVQQGDKVDSYLCRYQPPTFVPGNQPKPADVVCHRWHGFLPAAFVTKILLAALKASGEQWFALSAEAFGGNGYQILEDDRKVMMWKYAD